jgi:hypothetical protein
MAPTLRVSAFGRVQSDPLGKKKIRLLIGPQRKFL